MSSSPAEVFRPVNKNSQLERRRILNEVVDEAQPPGEKDKPVAKSVTPVEEGEKTSETEVTLQQKALREMAADAKKFCEMEQLAEASERTVCYENFSESAAIACHSMREARKKRRVARSYDEDDEIDAAELRVMELLEKREFYFPEGISKSDLQEFSFPTEAAKFDRNDNVEVFDDGKWWLARVEHRRPMTYAEVIVRERDGTDLEKSGGGPWVYYVSLREIQSKKSYDHIGYTEYEIRRSGPQRREKLEAKKDRIFREACRSEYVIEFMDVIWAIAQNDPRTGRFQLVRREKKGEWKEVIIQYQAAQRAMHVAVGDEERPCDHAGIKEPELKDTDLSRLDLDSVVLAHEPFGLEIGQGRNLLDGLRSRPGSRSSHSTRSRSPAPTRNFPPVKTPGKKGKFWRPNSALSQSLRKKIQKQQAARNRKPKGNKKPFFIPNLARVPRTASSGNGGKDSGQSEVSLTGGICDKGDIVPAGGVESNVGQNEKFPVASRLEKVNATMAEALDTEAGLPTMQRTESYVFRQFDKMRASMRRKTAAAQGAQLKKTKRPVIRKPRKPKPGAEAKIQKGQNPATKCPPGKRQSKQRSAPAFVMPQTNVDDDHNILNMSLESEEEAGPQRKDREWELPLPNSRQEKDEANNAPPITEVLPLAPSMDFCWDRRALDDISKTLNGIYNLSGDSIRRLAILEKRVGKTDMVKMSKEVDILMQFVRKTNGDVTKMKSVQESTLSAILNVSESLSGSSTGSPPLAALLARDSKTPSIHFTPPKGSLMDGAVASLAQAAEQVLRQSPEGLLKTPATASPPVDGKTRKQRLETEVTPKAAGNTAEESKKGGKKDEKDTRSDAVRKISTNQPGKSSAAKSKQLAAGGGGGSSGDGDDDEDKRKRRDRHDKSRVPVEKVPSDDEDEEVEEEEKSSGEEGSAVSVERDDDGIGVVVPDTPPEQQGGTPESESGSSEDEEVKKLKQKLEDDRARLALIRGQTKDILKKDADRRWKEVKKEKKMAELKATNKKLQRELAEAARFQRELSSSVHSSDVERKNKKNILIAKTLSSKRPVSDFGAIDLTASPPAAKRIRHMSTSVASGGGESSDEEGKKEQLSGDFVPETLEPLTCTPLPPHIFRTKNELGFYVRVPREVQEAAVPLTVGKISDWTDDHYKVAISHCVPSADFQGKDDFNAFQLFGKLGTEHPAEVPIVTGVKNELPFYAGGLEQLEEVELNDPIRYISQQRWERLQKGAIPEVNKAKNPGGQAYVLFRTILQEDHNWRELLLLDENQVSWSRKYTTFSDVYSNQPRLFSEFFRLFILGAQFKHLDQPFTPKSKSWCKKFTQTWNKYRLNDKGAILKKFGLQKLSPAEVKALKEKVSKKEDKLKNPDPSSSSSSSGDSSDTNDGSSDSDDSSKPSTSKQKKKKTSNKGAVTPAVKPTPQSVPKSVSKSRILPLPTPKSEGRKEVEKKETAKKKHLKAKKKEEKVEKEELVVKEKPRGKEKERENEKEVKSAQKESSEKQGKRTWKSGEKETKSSRKESSEKEMKSSRKESGEKEMKSSRKESGEKEAKSSRKESGEKEAKSSRKESGEKESKSARKESSAKKSEKKKKSD